MPDTISTTSIDQRSMEDVHRTVSIPQSGGRWGRVLAFAGPAYLVSVGYMDPGNWATDIAGGSRFGYRLIWVLLMSNVMAVLLQTLSARLGIVTGCDLAQACRDTYSPIIRTTLFVLCEIAIAACDLAEVLGTAIGLHLLFPSVPLILAVLVTALDVFLLLVIQRWGMRKMEAFIISLITIIGACFILEIFLSKPSWSGIATGFLPTGLSTNGGENSSLYIAISIIGATVMPHNLYLHSALVQSRRVVQTDLGKAQACRFNLLDSTIALNIAFLVNAAILIVAAATFHRNGSIPEKIEDAHRLLRDLLGTRAAPIAFALALICAGQSSTITGTLAGQITMEGFLHFRMRPWLRRLITRLLAIVPAVLVIYFSKGADTDRLLIFSQVVLSLQLPFAVIPLVKFTGNRQKMGAFANRWWVHAAAWLVAAIIVGLNGKLVLDQLMEWQTTAGRFHWAVIFIAWPIFTILAGLLVWLVIRPEHTPTPAVVPPSAQDVIAAAQVSGRIFRRIGVALEAKMDDAAMLAQAVQLARANRAELVLMHVVEGVGGQWHGSQAGDAEFRHDDQYISALAEHLRGELLPDGVPAVTTALGFGGVKSELIRLSQELKLDLLVAGSHGHRRLGDLLRGETINGVRHALNIPVLAVRRAGGETQAGG